MNTKIWKEIKEKILSYSNIYLQIKKQTSKIVQVSVPSP